MNPFSQDIVTKPRSIENSISGLNNRVLEHVLNEFNTLIEPPLPRKDVKLDHIQFITSRDPGYGKSHLLGRVFHHLNRKANLIYITPFSDHSTAWKSILNQVTNELNFPDDHVGNQTASPQISYFAHGVLSRLLIQCAQKGTIQVKNVPHLEKYIQNTPLEHVSDIIIKTIREKKNQIADELSSCNLQLNYTVMTWIHVLLTFAYDDDFMKKEICQEWMKSNCIDPNEANDIGIRPGDVLPYEMSIAQLNESCKTILFDLCQLAGLYRPFVFCFDQTENYGLDENLAKTLGGILTTLNDEFHNHMTILTSNQEPWKNTIVPFWEDAYTHRLSNPIELEGINKQQAKEFIRGRLDGIQIEPQKVHQMLEDDWLDSLFSNTTIGIRHFIHKCRDQWDHESHTIPPSKPLEQFFKEYQRIVQSNRKRMVYDRDTFIWLVKTLMPEGYECRAVNREKYFHFQILNENEIYYFGFQDNTNWSSWNAITKRSYQLVPGQIKRGIFFRIFNQPPIPKQTWKVADFINKAKQNHILTVYSLTKDELVLLYAGHDMFLDATGQNIEYSPDQVKMFLREQFKPLWSKLLEQEQNESPEIPNNDEFKKKIVDIMQIEKFLGVDDLKSRIPGITEEKIIAVQNDMTEINYYKSPTMSYLQWLS